MRARTRITQEAKARGFTASELARRLGWYRSNLSAMDAGRRSISMRTLARLSQVLGCSLVDLIEAGADPRQRLFHQPHLNARLSERDLTASDGTEKGWVHAAQLAWRRHLNAAARSG